jgi:hypothetical protein
MNSVYRFLITGRLALLSAAAAGQGCYCEQLTKADEQALIKGMGFEYSPGKAQELVDTFGGYFRRYLKIIAKPENCADAKTALAIVCDQKENAKLTREGRYIFYKPAFLEAVQEASLGKGDRFVLAHEVAHHALGHTVRVRFINTKDKAQQGVLAGAYQVFETFPPPTLSSKPPRRITIIPEHLHELEADALGLWIVLRNGLLPSDVDAVFRVLPALLGKDANLSGPTHPSLAMRQRLIKRLLLPLDGAKLLGRQRPVAYSATGLGFTPELDSATVTTYIQGLTEGAYTFELMAAHDSLVNQFTPDEKKQRRQLDQIHRFSVEGVGGVQVQQPALAVGAEPVAAAAVANGFGGLRVGWQPWYNRHRLEVDLLYNPQTFTTQARFGDSWQTVETFRTTYLHLRPRYVRQLRLRQAGLGTSTRLWAATAGVSVVMPLRFRYENAGLSAWQLPRQGVGFAPVVGVGFGQADPEKRFGGHWRLTLLYQYQCLNLTPVVADSRIRAGLHTLSLDFSIRLW